MFLQNYKNVCRLKQYITYLLLTFWQSQEKVANRNFTLLHMFCQSTMDHRWISSVSSNEHINVLLFGEPLRKIPRGVHKGWFTALSIQSFNVHSGTKYYVKEVKHLKTSSKRNFWMNIVIYSCRIETSGYLSLASILPATLQSHTTSSIFLYH